MKNKILIILVFVFHVFLINGQENVEVLEGRVSFVTSKNIYVKFENTNNIKIGDPLFISNAGEPCLLVRNKSSISVVCSRINDCEVTKETVVYYNYISKEKEETPKENNEDLEIVSVDKPIESVANDQKESLYSEKIKGRLSLASYSTLSNSSDDRHRLMSRFSLNASHINDSKLSVETYVNYRKNTISGDSDQLSANADYFKVYNLALSYNIDPTFSMSIGRKINNKTSSLGANDGLQLEKFFGKNYVGAITGFRPDISDFGFNTKLFQYGAYVGRLVENKNSYSQTTIGFVEQRNTSEIDRRYTHVQHSSTFFKKLHLFASAELDIYTNASDSLNNNPRLTNLYISTRYRFNRKINLSLSYDSRKRIIYYETYETEVERLLAEDLARQGIRARLNLKPLKFLSTGVSYSKRFLSDTDNKSDNIYTYITFSKIPSVGGRINFTYNMNTSNYLESNIAAVRYSKPLFKKKLNTDFYYRFVKYDYVNNNIAFDQEYFGINLSYAINRSLLLGLSGELSIYNQEENIRLNTRIVKRFYRNKKK